MDDTDRLGVDPVQVVGVHDDGRQVGREMAQHIDRRPFERLHALGRLVDVAAPVSSAGVTPARRRDTSRAARLERRRNRRPVAHVRLDGARERIERLAPPHGIAAERDHQRAGRGRRRERIAHEAGLADAGLAADERDAGTVAGAEHAGEPLQLAVAPDDPIRRVRAPSTPDNLPVGCSPWSGRSAGRVVHRRLSACARRCPMVGRRVVPEPFRSRCSSASRRNRSARPVMRFVSGCGTCSCRSPFVLTGRDQVLIT